MIRRTPIADLAALEALRPAWSDLLARSSTDEPTLGPAWMISWWRVWGETGGRALKTIAIHDDDRLVGLVPLLSRVARYRNAIPFRRLEFLASGEDEEEETCSDYLAVIAERGRERDVVEHVRRALLEGEFGSWDEIVLSSMSGDSPVAPLLREVLETQEAEVTIDDRTSSPYVPLPATWDEYLALLPSQRRYTVRRALREIETWNGAPPALRVASTEDALDPALDTLIRLHRERWGESGGAFRSERFEAFHRAVIRELFAEDALELGWIEAGGRPVAAFYNLIWKGKAHFYQSGRAVDLPPQVRVGIVMHALLIRRSIELGRREYDFLVLTSQYNRTLAIAQRPLVTLRAARPTIVESARIITEKAASGARKIRKTVKRALGTE